MIRKETYESRSILDADLMDGVKRLIDADLFIAKYREDIQRECPDEEVLSLHGELLDTLRKATQAFKQAICENLKIDSTDLDEKSSIILSEAVKSAQKLIHEELSGMKFTSWTMRSFSAIMLELKNIFEDVVNRWLKFYLKEFWIMIELGINEFSTMDQYVYWKLMTTLEKINPEIKYLRDLFADFIQGVSMKIGMAILHTGFDFKKKVNNALELLNKGVEECPAMTPYVAKYEITRLKHRISIYARTMKNKWFLGMYAKSEILDQYEKELFENVWNTPRVSFDDSADYSPIESENNIARMVTNDDKTTDSETMQEKLSTSLIDNQQGDRVSQEEHDIMEFLNQNKDIEDARKERMAKMFSQLQDKEVKEEKYFFNEKGKLAKLVRFKGEDQFHLIRNDENGNKVICKQINNQWFQVDKSIVMNGKEASQFFVSKPFNFHLLDPTVGGTLAMSGSGAIGGFLYGLVEGKEKIGVLSKGLMKDASSSVAMTALMTTMPFVAVSIASVIGVKALNDLRTNQFIKGNKKVTIISSILARTGTKAAVTIGGAAIGQTLIPIPFLGAFIGGVVGGFTATALESSYDSLVAKRVSMELLCFFCIVKMKKRGKWAKEKLTPEDGGEHEETMKKFLEVLSLVVVNPIDAEAFENELIMTKQADMFDLIAEMYASIADKDKGEVVDENFEQRWKTLVIYSFFSYYYFLLFSQLDALQDEGKITEDQKIEALESYDNLLDVSEVLEWITPQISIFGQYKPYGRFIICINGMLKDCKIVTRFKISDPKKTQEHKPKEEEKLAEQNEAPVQANRPKE